VAEVLFLCTGNSARSILGEVLLNELGRGRFRAYSAGSHPVGRVNPGAIEKLRAEGHETAGLRSKSWHEFTGADAPALDLVVTVCDSAAAETCPVWPGSPANLHWSLPDPAACRDPAERKAAFERVYTELRTKIMQLVASADG